jgi:hypothetical protein
MLIPWSIQLSWHQSFDDARKQRRLTVPGPGRFSQNVRYAEKSGSNPLAPSVQPASPAGSPHVCQRSISTMTVTPL